MDQSGKRMKMAYEYSQVTQVFSIGSIPDCWVYPVSILIHAYEQLKLQQDPEFKFVVQPNFPDD